MPKHTFFLIQGDKDFVFSFIRVEKVCSSSAILKCVDLKSLMIFSTVPVCIESKVYRFELIRVKSMFENEILFRQLPFSISFQSDIHFYVFREEETS